MSIERRQSSGGAPAQELGGGHRVQLLPVHRQEPADFNRGAGGELDLGLAGFKDAGDGEVGGPGRGFGEAVAQALA
jgi:hypothetical protein